MKKTPILSVALLLSACVVGRDYQTPEIAVPNKWSENVISKNIVTEKWWEIFHDETLNQLISQATTENLNFKQALSRVKEARILRSETIATGLPSLDAKGFASRRFNNSAAGAGGAGIGSQAINIFQLGFDAVWELDFFGGIQRAIEAADASIDVEIENSQDVLLSLQSEIAREYITLRANQQLVTTHNALLFAQAETLRLLEIRERSGFNTGLEVAQAQAQYDNTAANLPRYQVEIEKSIHALSVLLGNEPTALKKRLSVTRTIPKATFSLTNFPSELLKCRPDIRKAERQLAVANAYVGIAIAELYPKVNLAAFIGLQNLKITDFTPMGKSWSSAATLTMPLFNWGKLNANIEAKDAQYEQALLNYQQTILTAFQEVENVLTIYRNEQIRHEFLMKAINSNQTVLHLAKERYEKGLTGFLDVLQSQQTLYQTQIEQLNSSAILSAQIVALSKALGVQVQ